MSKQAIKPPTLRTGAAYMVVGAIGAIAYLVMLVGLIELFSVAPLPASVISFTPIVIASYFVSYSWVFRSTSAHRKAFIRYLIVTSAGLGLNTGIMFVSVDVLDLSYVYGLLLVMVAVPVNNFLFNHYWTFSFDEKV